MDKDVIMEMVGGNINTSGSGRGIHALLP